MMASGASNSDRHEHRGGREEASAQPVHYASATSSVGVPRDADRLAGCKRRTGARDLGAAIASPSSSRASRARNMPETNARSVTPASDSLSCLRAQYASLPGARRCRRSSSSRPGNRRRSGSAAADRFPRGVPTCSSAPAFITAIWSDIESASSWSCVTNRNVTPTRRCRSFSSARTCLRSSGSSADSGSSSSRTSGSEHERAGERDALPLAAGKLRGLSRCFASSRTCSQHVAHALFDHPAPLCAQAELDVALDGQMRKQRVALKNGVDVALVRRQMHRCARHSARLRRRSAASNPATIRRVVVLPHPEGPSSEKKAPRGDRERNTVHARGASGSASKGRAVPGSTPLKLHVTASSAGFGRYVSRAIAASKS